MSSHFKRQKDRQQLSSSSVRRGLANQTGFEYPVQADGQSAVEAADEAFARLNVLFICSRNQWRSPTAETVWRKHPALSVRSAGTSPNARRRVTEDDLRWSETIFVMEEKHKSRLQAEFGRLLEHTPIHVLGIPDEYRYMDPELVTELRQSVAGILGLAYPTRHRGSM